MMIPANIFPISTTELAGQVSADSLMSGVLLFMEMGSYTVAAIVFIASIAVPVSKITIIFISCWQFITSGNTRFIGK